MRTDRRGMIRGGIRVAVGMALWGEASQEALAQGTGFPRSGYPRGESADNPPTLLACLPNLDWVPADRGPLLIVAPERARLQSKVVSHFYDIPHRVERVAVDAEQVRAGKNGFRLATISPRYRRKLVAAGSLSVVVPETMAVIRYKNLPEPDLFQGVLPEYRPSLLLATLSKPQWNRLMSVDGLGMDDLRRDQQAMFAGLLPATTQLYRTNPPAPGQSVGITEAVPLTTVKRLNARLRFYKELAWSFVDKKGGLTSITGQFDNKKPVYRLQTSPNPSVAYHSYEERTASENAENISIFGVNVLEAQPNHAKPSDIDYDAAIWDAAVSLLEAKTVGDLITRIREATRMEIYADQRYARLPVYTRAVVNTGVRAGDILKALALSVTGTYRRVESGTDEAFVMTDDRIGSGVRLTLLNDWIQSAQAKLREVRESAITLAQEVHAIDNAPWALREDMAPSAALQERMVSFQGLPVLSTANPDERLVPVSDLPPGVQARVRSQQKYRRERAENQEEPPPTPLREDGVIIGTKPVLAVVLPEIGTVPFSHSELLLQGSNTDQYSDSELSWYKSGTHVPDMSASLPVQVGAGWFQKRVLGVSVKNAGDARKAARLAKARHFDALLFSVGDQSPSTIAEWLSAARKIVPDIPVWLKVSVFRENSVEHSDTMYTNEKYPMDRNILGETHTKSLQRPVFSSDLAVPFPTPSDSGTGNYIAVGDRDTFHAIQSRLVSLAKLAPKITGIVFMGATPPGYEEYNAPFRMPPDRELGYHSALRLAFLRETGTDPIDLSPFGELTRQGWMPSDNAMPTWVSLPYFPDLGPNVRNAHIDGKPATELAAKDLYPRWQDFRTKQLSVALDTLRSAIATEVPTLELLMPNQDIWGGLKTWESSAVAISPPEPISSTNPALHPVFIWLPFVYKDITPPGTVPLKGNERFARQLNRFVSWMSTPPTPEAKQMIASTKFGLLLDLTAAPLADAEELLSQIIIES